MIVYNNFLKILLMSYINFWVLKKSLYFVLGYVENV